MRIQLTNTEIEIAALRVEMQQQEEEVAKLENLVDTVPRVEAELTRLDRDYDVVRAKYQQLLEQLETANIGEDVEASIDEVQFRIIEPPFAGRNPAGPQRQLFLLVVLVGAIGLGVAVMFLLNVLNPVYFSARAVTETTGIPVLGAVSYFMTDEEVAREQKSHWHFGVALGLLIVMFAATSIFADTLSPVLRSIMGRL